MCTCEGAHVEKQAHLYLCQGMLPVRSSWLLLFTLLLWLFSFCLLSCCRLRPRYAQPPSQNQGTTLQTPSHPTLSHRPKQSLGKHSEQPQQTPTYPKHMATKGRGPAPNSLVLLAFPLFLSSLGKTAVPPALFDSPLFATSTPTTER